MEVSFDGYILTGDLPPALSAIDYCSDEEDDDEDDDDDDDEYDYDKDGRRRWRKKAKCKGDDPSKAIDWHRLFPNFDYAEFDRDQDAMAIENSTANQLWSKMYSIKRARTTFQKMLGRSPGDSTDWAYVRNYADCDYYCEQLLHSSILPGVVGVDVEMENDQVAFRDWPSKWRTIRAHSRLAKGMFARLLQAANCDGLVVVFDLYALAKPHSWEGGIEMDARRRHWSRSKIALPTSSLPPSLVRFILDPGIVRFGWALHCDWSSLYNSFGLLVPQRSYLDAQGPWRYVLKDKVSGAGNGLADAAVALFGVRLDKSIRGYKHFWHGMAPFGKIPHYMLNYAMQDAQTSLDVAVQILLETNWLMPGGVWFAPNVKTIPLPGVRKRIYSLFGKPDKEQSGCFFDYRKSLSKTETEDLWISGKELVDRAYSTDDSGVGMEGSAASSSGMKEEEIIQQHGTNGKIDIDFDNYELGLGDVQEQLDDEEEDSDSDIAIEDKGEQSDHCDESEPESYCSGQRSSGQFFEKDVRVVVSRTDRTATRNQGQILSRAGRSYTRINRMCHFSKKGLENQYWQELPPRVQLFIKRCKHDACSVFRKLPNDQSGKDNRWSWCPAFTIFRGTTRYKLKRLIQNCVGENNHVLYCKARKLLDNNLECAWKAAFQPALLKGAERQSPWGSLRKFQKSVLEKSNPVRSKLIEKRSPQFSTSFSRNKEESAVSRRASGRRTNLLQNIVISSLSTM